MNDGKTIPIKTLPDLISYYERRLQKIADHYQERARWGHGALDTHEITLIKEFLNLMYGLDRDEEIEQLKQKMELTFERFRKYISLAYHEVDQYCRTREEREEGEEDDESGTD